MLSTLLEIGRVFNEEKILKHHRYVKRAPQRDINPKNTKAFGNSTRFFVAPVNDDGSFDFERCEEFDDEYLREKCFYLDYKTADRFDTYKKYIFGDVFRIVDEKTQKDSGGNFLMGNSKVSGFYGQNSFLRGQSDASTIKNDLIQEFRKSFKNQLSDITGHLELLPNCYIHFDFQGRMWWELEEPLRVLNEKMLSEIVALHEETGKFVLTKPIYKTLMPTAEGKIPGFLLSNSYKSRTFDSLNDVMNLLYVIDFSTKAVIRKGEVKIIVLPRGEGLSAEDIEGFFTRQALERNKPVNKAKEIRDAVEAIADERREALAELVEAEDAPEEIFQDALDGATEEMVQFDFIFSKAGSGPSSPDVDLIEVPGLQRGLLEQLSTRVVKIRKEVEEHRPKSKKIRQLSILQSFLNILGDTTKAKKKYHNHLFKVLPQIYTGTYYHDAVLLPALIEKTEFNIRNEQANFGLMKFDFYFLTKLQNQGDRMKEITDSPSYQLGAVLGRLARQFAGPKSPIKSFEKNYVGLLSRRITSLPEVVRMGNEINQKLVMHELTRFTHKDSHVFSESVKNFGGVYNKDECAFGFFESYFAPLPKKEIADVPAEETDDENNLAA